jgi:hypothetical protein
MQQCFWPQSLLLLSFIKLAFTFLPTLVLLVHTYLDRGKKTLAHLVRLSPSTLDRLHVLDRAPYIGVIAP